MVPGFVDRSRRGSLGSMLEVPMHDQTFASTDVAVRLALFSPEEELALAGFLAGYGGLTREAYALDLRQYVTWCTEHAVMLFGARRADIESFGRHLETRGRARATIARRLCTITAFYRYAEEEGLIATSPAVHVRRPRLDYESHATGLDRNEVGAMLVAAGLAGARDHALISLLALNGLRVSEAGSRRGRRDGSRRDRLQRCALSVQDAVGVGVSARLQQHDRLRRLLPGRRGPRLLVARRSTPSCPVGRVSVSGDSTSPFRKVVEAVVQHRAR
jgi:integrase